MSHTSRNPIIDIHQPLRKSGVMISASPARTLDLISSKKGFTLIELLCVMAIIGLMLVIVVPATGSLKGSGSVNDASLNIALILEQARSYAMANNTYVWVGFSTGSNNGTSRVIVSAVAGTTGLASDLNSETTYRPVIKPKAFENIRIQDQVSSTLPGRVSADDISTSSVGSFSQRVADANIQFRQIIQFEPKGNVRIKAAQSRWIEIGLQPSKGGHNSDDNVAAFQIAGLTGQVNVLRQ